MERSSDERARNRPSQGRARELFTAASSTVRAALFRVVPTGVSSASVYRWRLAR